MAEREKPRELVTLQELAVSSAYEIAAIVAVLEQEEIVRREDVLEEITRLERGRPQAQ